MPGYLIIPVLRLPLASRRLLNTDRRAMVLCFSGIGGLELYIVALLVILLKGLGHELMQTHVQALHGVYPV